MLLRLITTSALLSMVFIAVCGLTVGAFALYHMGRK
jgi:hypothetical protein